MDEEEGMITMSPPSTPLLSPSRLSSSRLSPYTPTFNATLLTPLVETPKLETPLVKTPKLTTPLKISNKISVQELEQLISTNTFLQN